MILRATSFVLLMGTLSSCALWDRAAQAPTAFEIRDLEEIRVLTPLASPTKMDGRTTVEFGPKVETRNTNCVPTRDTFECRYETRTTAFFDQPADQWVERQVVVVRQTNGRWRTLQ